MKGKWTWTPAVINSWSPESVTLLKKEQKDINDDPLFGEEEE